MLTFHSKKGNDLFILKYDGAAVPSATPEGLNLCNPRSDRNGSGGRHLGEKWRSAVVAARDGVRRRTKRAVAAYRGNKCKSEANSDLRAMLCGTAAAIGAHLLACGWGTGVFDMEVNLCKSETNLRLTAHVGGQQVRAKSATAPRWIAGRRCRAAQIIIKPKYIGSTSI